MTFDDFYFMDFNGISPREDDILQLNWNRKAGPDEWVGRKNNGW